MRLGHPAVSFFLSVSLTYVTGGGNGGGSKGRGKRGLTEIARESERTTTVHRRRMFLIGCERDDS